MYEMVCPRGSIFEIYRPMSEAPSEEPCPACDGLATRIFSPLHARFEDTDGIGSERKDGTAGTYVTLPDIPDGRGGFRPVTVADLPNRSAFKDHVKRVGGLSLGDEGRYRSTR